jgi:hypothetical protein
MYHLFRALEVEPFGVPAGPELVHEEYQLRWYARIRRGDSVYERAGQLEERWQSDVSPRSQRANPRGRPG